MATKKEPEKKETKRKSTTKKDPVETKPKEVKRDEPIFTDPEAEELERAEDEMKRHEKLTETPIPDPVDMIMDEKGEIKEVEPIPDPEPLPEGVVEGEPDILPKDEVDEWINTPIPEAKPEKLGTLVIDEKLERAKGEKEELGMITTADLKMPAIAKRNKAHDAANDTIITTGDFKPRKWGKSRKL